MLGLGGGLIYWGLLPLIRAELVPPAVMLGETLHEEAVRQFGSDTLIPSLIEGFVVREGTGCTGRGAAGVCGSTCRSLGRTFGRAARAIRGVRRRRCDDYKHTMALR